MRRAGNAIRAAVLPLLLFLLPGPAPGSEEPAGVEAAMTWKIGRAASEPRTLALAKTPPEGVEPLVGHADARYGRVALAAGSPLLYAMEASDEGVRLWLDRDRDGSLLDEETFTLRSEEVKGEITIHVMLDLGDADPHEVPIRFKHVKASGALRMTALARREGEVVLEGRARWIYVEDHGGDLRYDVADDDAMFVDLDGNGAVRTGKDSDERVRPGKAFRVRDAGYVVRTTGVSLDRVVFVRVAETPPEPPSPWTAERLPGRGGRRAFGPALPLTEMARRYEETAKRDRAVRADYTGGRQMVLEEIGRSGGPDAFSFLMRLYRREKLPQLLVAAVRAMGYREYGEGASRVASILRRAKDPQLRMAAIETLHHMDAAGREEAIARALRDETDRLVADQASAHLALVGTARAFSLLEEAIPEIPAAHRLAAYRALTRYRSTPPSDRLVESLAREDDPALRALALRDALTMRLSTRRILALESAEDAKRHPELALAVVEILGRWGDVESVAAILPLADRASGRTRDRLIVLLRPVRDAAAIDLVLAAMNSDCRERRSLAAKVLPHYPVLRVAPALARLLGSSRDGTSIVALIEALGKLRARVGAEAVAAAARRRPKDAGIREAALVALSRMGFELPVVRSFFRDCLGTTDWEARTDVLDIAGRSRDPAAADLLMEHLADTRWQVRLVAAHALGFSRAKRAILPLVARLEVEEHPRVRTVIAESLYRITGENLYDEAKLWRMWWTAKGEDFAVPRRVPKRPARAGGGGRYGDFYGVPVDSDRIVFVIDQSGSMDAETKGPDGKATMRYAAAVMATLRVVEKLKRDARVNVILFESGIHPWQSKLVRMTKQAREELRKFLLSRGPRGGTNLYDGIEAALHMAGAETIYLLSDGQPSAGRYTAEADILREVRRINKRRGVAIHCVSLGMDSSLLKKLAEENWGTYAKE